MERKYSDSGKAILSGEGIARLRAVSGIAKEFVLERDFRYQTETRSVIAGCEFRDLPDDFFVPVYDSQLLVKLIKGLTTKDAPIEVSYTVKEKQFGLNTRQLYTVILKNPKTGKSFDVKAQGVVWDDAKCSIAKTYLENKGARFKVKGSSFSFVLSPDQFNDLMGNAGTIGADMIKFMNKDGKVVAEATNTKLLDGPKYYEVVCASDGGDLEEFICDVENMEKLPRDLTFKVTMSDGGCCFDCEEKRFFTIFGNRKGKG